MDVVRRFLPFLFARTPPSEDDEAQQALLGAETVQDEGIEGAMGLDGVRDAQRPGWDRERFKAWATHELLAKSLGRTGLQVAVFFLLLIAAILLSIFQFIGDSGSHTRVVLQFSASVVALATSFTLVGNVALTHNELVSHSSLTQDSSSVLID